jgi:putative ABC transport system ATP-binding protein
MSDVQRPIVAAQDVYKEYSLGKVVVQALRGVSVEIQRGEFTTIAGPSGSGKTTLLNLIGCVDVPTRGSVEIAGKITSSLNDKQLTELRLRKLGFIFQSFNLIAVLDIAQNIEFPLLLQGDLTTGERAQRVDEMLEKVGLTPQRKQRPNEISGGQRQRVAIARALVTRPEIVLADEPTANLDSVTGTTIIDLMKDLNAREATTFIFSTHDPKVMSRAGRIIQMVDGRLVDPEQAASHPSHEEAHP